jgi:putative glutamine amidotransferase
VSPPAIGICAAIERARWAAWDATAIMVPRTYSQAVQRAGATAWIMPPDRAAPDHPDEWLNRIDALLLIGGGDVLPTLYGAASDADTARIWPERDNFEVTLITSAIEREMPVLGVCRGMQLMNAALGGTLEPHLPDRLGSDRHLPAPGHFGEHEVRLDPGSLAARAVGAETTVVRSHHHQGLDRLGDGLVASGWSRPDDVIEAVELPGHAYVLGVLWHPEEDEASGVIGSLVDAARTKVGAA